MDTPPSAQAGFAAFCFVCVSRCASRLSLEDFSQVHPAIQRCLQKVQTVNEGSLPPPPQRKADVGFHVVRNARQLLAFFFRLLLEQKVRIVPLEEERNWVLLWSYAEIQVARVMCSSAVFPSHVAVIPHCISVFSCKEAVV